MKVLVAHNFYQRPGGEDVVFRSETALLEARGHEVTRYTANNDDVGRYSAAGLASRTVWNWDTVREVRALIRTKRPDLVHVHNTLPLISPAIYHAAYAEGVPVAQTLHNFRLMCPKAELRRDGRICEDCIGTKTRWPAAVHGCYRNSRLASGVVAAMLTTHRAIGTWRHKVRRYIAMSEFMKRKMVSDGWPAERLVVKPNFLARDPGMGPIGGNYVLFVGRLSEEKGVRTLLSAASRMASPVPIKIAGQGPLMPADASPGGNVEWLGHCPPERIVTLMQGALALVFPSEWYEGCPLTIIEALASGLPVIASRLGNMADMIAHGRTGLLFTPGDADALAETMAWAVSHPEAMAGMALEARAEFERRYTLERNYQSLMQIYRETVNAVCS